MLGPYLSGRIMRNKLFWHLGYSLIFFIQQRVKKYELLSILIEFNIHMKYLDYAELTLNLILIPFDLAY